MATRGTGRRFTKAAVIAMLVLGLGASALGITAWLREVAGASPAQLLALGALLALSAGVALLCLSRSYRTKELRQMEAMDAA
jgi:hypothetical protein